MRKLALIAATVTLIASAHLAVAEENYPQPVQVVAAVLQLSPEQLAALINMLQQREQALQPLQQELRMHQEAIGKALQTPAPDPFALGQLLIETRTIEQQIAATRLQASAQFQQVLDQDQLERLQQIQSTAGVCQILPAFEAMGLL
ncbi:MAG TPA: periplasmic heavy metal sensor [Thermoanaerobaculia bacterium]|jgi:uncharacterized membrane protein|nr:periplasmic heavy metal sensor [Thermoanaerobaculia bacterium]